MLKTKLKKNKYILLNNFCKPKSKYQIWFKLSYSAIKFYKNISINKFIIFFDIPVIEDDGISMLPSCVEFNNINLKFDYRDPEYYVEGKK